jgi:hypothetical protein
MSAKMEVLGTVFSRLEPILLDRDSVCMLILLQFLSMYIAGSFAYFIIPILSPRVSSLPPRRQQQLAVAIPVIILKATIMFLITDTLLSTADSRNGPGPSFDYRFQTLFFVAVSYIFEILQRPSSAELIGHHLYLQALPFYYWFWLCNKSPDHAELVTRFFELMVLLGPGATDIASDITFLLYYCAPRSNVGLVVIRATSWLATGARALQWIVLIGYGYSNYGGAKDVLAWWEKSIFVVSVALWVWTEVDEILKIRGMVGKFSKSLKQKDT